MTFRRLCLFCGVVRLIMSGTPSAAQTADGAWRAMYPHIECLALAEKAPQILAGSADAHLLAARDILAATPEVFGPRTPNFKPDGSDADSFGRPPEAGVDARVTLGRYVQLIAERTRLRVEGPPPVYPEGMTVSPASENEDIRQRNYANEYAGLGCAGLLNE